jgi:hypothetical protein
MKTLSVMILVVLLAGCADTGNGSPGSYGAGSSQKDNQYKGGGGGGGGGGGY